MSYAAINWTYTKVVLYNGLKPIELAVLRALCWYYRDENRTEWDHNCYVSTETLAKTVNASIATVNRAKNTLRRKHFITWDREANFGDVRKSNNYRLVNCPPLDKILKENASKRAEGKPYDDNHTPGPPVPDPGRHFDRPDPAKLVDAFPKPLNTLQAEWMADALAFVGDEPKHRKSLFTALHRAPDLDTYAKCLRRVYANSNRGRMINNRIGYLLKSLTTARKKAAEKTPG